MAVLSMSDSNVPVTGRSAGDGAQWLLFYPTKANYRPIAADLEFNRDKSSTIALAGAVKRAALNRVRVERAVGDHLDACGS